MAPGTFYYFVLIIGLNGLVARILGLYMPLYLKEIGFSGVQTGLYFSVSAISAICTDTGGR